MNRTTLSANMVQICGIALVICSLLGNIAVLDGTIPRHFLPVTAAMIAIGLSMNTWGMRLRNKELQS